MSNFWEKSTHQACVFFLEGLIPFRSPQSGGFGMKRVESVSCRALGCTGSAVDLLCSEKPQKNIPSG